MRRLVLLLVVVSLSGCVRNRQYHDVATSVTPAHPPDVLYTMAFIEFDDMGEFWDRRQLEETLNAIRHANNNGEKQAIVVTFIHGWKHNASDHSGNVWGFRSQLQLIADQYKPIPVVGVYIGWRGNVTNIPLVKQFTFYNRRNAAIRIPGANLTEALHQIIRTTKQGENNSSMCVVIGHSFGGMVLERALTQSVVSLINNYDADKKTGITKITAPADLIAFVNSAAPATESKQLLGMLKARHYQVVAKLDEKADLQKLQALRHELMPNELQELRELEQGSERPFFLSITSKGDTATGLAMPIGQAPSKLTKSMRKYKPDNEPRNENEAANLKHPEWPWGVTSQSSFYLHSTANMPALQSHTIDKRGNIGEGQKIYKCFLLRDEYCIATREHRWNDTPYWAMQMPVEFVPDHGNIFRNEFRTLLMQFLPSPVEMKARGTTRTQTRFLQEKKTTP